MLQIKRLNGLTVGFVFLTALNSSGVIAKAPEWSYSYENDGFTLSISSSPCYDNNEKATMSMQLYGTKSGASINANASCDCGEAIVLDDGKPITPQSFARLVSEAVSTQIKNYRCEAIE